MFYFIRGYATQPLVVSFALSKSLPVPAKFDAQPSAVDTGDPVSGQLYFKKVDVTDGSDFAVDKGVRLVAVNSHATDACVVTVVNPDKVELGLTQTNQDLSVTLAAGKMAIFPELIASFASAGRVKITVAESGGTNGRANTYVAVLPI